MKTTSLILAALVVCTTFCGSQQALPIDPQVKSALIEYIKTHYQSPEDYILSKFRDHDVVFLGEFHKFKQNLELLHRLIPQLYERGIYILATEFARREDQYLIDSLLQSASYDERLARRITFQHNVHWPFQEYVDVYKVAWTLNRGLPKGKRPFRVLGVNSSPDWSLLKKPEDRDNGQIMAKVWKSSSIEEDWAKVILDSVVGKNEKVLVYSGIHHAFTEYKQPVAVGGKFVRWNDIRMGNAVFNVIGKRAITIALHYPWNSADGWDAPLVFPADGYLDACFTREGATFIPIGFDTKGAPFGKLPGETSMYKFGYDNFTLEAFCDGYVYQCPLSDYLPVSLIDDFINKENLEYARLQSFDVRFRTATEEDFRNRARQQRDFQKRLPKYK